MPHEICMDCKEDNCSSCSIDTILNKIKEIGFKCVAGPLETHRGFLSLVDKAKSSEMSEKQIVVSFNDMCTSSLEPDMYSMFIDKILPALVTTRKALKASSIDWDSVEDIDGKLVLQGKGIADGSRYLTNEECADYIWATNLLGEDVSVETATGERQE